MPRPGPLLAAAAVVLALTVGAAVLVPAEPTDAGDPSRLAFEELTITATEVSGSTVELGIDARLRHAGAPAENVTVELRAIDRDTGIREARETIDVDSVEGERELAMDGSLVVDRDSDYRLEAVVFEDDRRIALGHTRVSGLDRLEPDYADTAVEFHRFSRAPLPSVEYEVRQVAGGEATVATSAYVTNTGTADETGLEVELLARQTDSNVVADRQRVSVGRLEPGETDTPTAELRVPDDYNYHLDAVLYHDGVVVDTAREPATLDPNGTLPEDPDESDDDGGFDAGEFEVDDDGSFEGDDGAMDDAADDGTSSGDAQPGFGLAAALVALLAGLVAAVRHRT